MPSGRLFMARASSQKLMSMPATVTTDGHRRVNPLVYFRPTAQTISKRPANTRIIQVMHDSQDCDAGEMPT
ncbi:hypothetical protein D9M71_731340 [compost metagenome]